MLVTESVKDTNNNTVGYIMSDGNFYNKYEAIKNIDSIENLKLLSNGVLRCDKELPVVTYNSVNKIEYRKLVKENPFVRDIQADLLLWKKDPLRGVLQIEGARQIGKTTEILKFGYKNYDYIIYVDLSNDVYNFVDNVTLLGAPLREWICTVGTQTYLII